MTERAWRSRVLGEVPVIVAGILIALGIEAAVKAAGERRVEREYLTELAAEFAASRLALEKNVEDLDAVIAAAQQLVASGRSGVGGIPTDSLNALIRDANSYVVFSQSTATFDALLATGDLRLIRNRELRNLLSGWRGAVFNLRLPEGYAIGTEELQDQLGRIPLAAVYQLAPVQSRDRAAYDSAIVTRAFENQIAARLLVAVWNRATTQETIEYAQRVEKALAAEL